MYTHSFFTPFFSENEVPAVPHRDSGTLPQAARAPPRDALDIPVESGRQFHKFQSLKGAF